MVNTKSSNCYVCGPDNPPGLHMRFEREGEAGSAAEYTPGAEHSGWDGILHGGVTFTLMDEALGWCLFFQDVRAVTAKIETRFLRSIPVGTKLHVRAWVVGKRRRLYDAKAEVRMGGAEGDLAAECAAVMWEVEE